MPPGFPERRSGGRAKRFLNDYSSQMRPFETEYEVMEFALNVGVQFGLTDATSDTALKFQGSLAF